MFAGANGSSKPVTKWLPFGRQMADTCEKLEDMQKQLRAAINRLRGDDAAMAIFQSLLDELRAAVDALRCDVMDAVILSSMLHEQADPAARGEMLGVARVRVLVRFVATAIVKIDERSRALQRACDGQLPAH